MIELQFFKCSKLYLIWVVNDVPVAYIVVEVRPEAGKLELLQIARLHFELTQDVLHYLLAGGGRQSHPGDPASVLTQLA